MHQDEGSYSFGTDISRTGNAISRFVDELKAGNASRMLHWEEEQSVCST
jgi:hypothetical protein